MTPGHVGARHQRPHVGTIKPLSPLQGVRSTIKTICGSGVRLAPHLSRLAVE